MGHHVDIVDIVKTLTQPKHNATSTDVRFDTKLTLQTTLPSKLKLRRLISSPHRPWRLHKNFFWPKFDQNLKIVFWDHLYLMSTVTMTFVQAIFVLVTFV